MKESQVSPAVSSAARRNAAVVFVCWAALALQTHGQSAFLYQRSGYKRAERVSVRDFGAAPDGRTDQSAAIQAASDYLGARGGGTMFIPSAAKCYEVATGVQLYANTTVLFAAGACVQLIDKAPQVCSPVGCRSVFFSDILSNPANIHIIGPGIIDGNREHNQGLGAGGAANCIFVLGWLNSSIEQITCRNAAADGILVSCSGPNVTYGPANTRCGDNILINRVTITNATRNDLTIIGGTHVSVRNSHFSYAHGVMPEAGYAVEPDYPGQYVTGLTTRNVEVDHNLGNGAYVALNFVLEPRAAFRFDFFSHDNLGTGFGVSAEPPGAGYSGAKITGRYINNGTIGVSLEWGSNVTVSADIGGSPTGLYCGAVSSLILRRGKAAGSVADFVNNRCVNPAFAGMVLAHHVASK